MKHKRQYEVLLGRMLARAREWRTANPSRTAKVQFNLPERVAVIGTISEAIKRGVVSVDEAGLELVKSLGPWGVPEEPTVLMVRCVLEEPDK